MTSPDVSPDTDAHDHDVKLFFLFLFFLLFFLFLLLDLERHVHIALDDVGSLDDVVHFRTGAFAESFEFGRVRDLEPDVSDDDVAVTGFGHHALDLQLFGLLFFLLFFLFLVFVGLFRFVRRLGHDELARGLNFGRCVCEVSADFPWTCGLAEIDYGNARRPYAVARVRKGHFHAVAAFTRLKLQRVLHHGLGIQAERLDFNMKDVFRREDLILSRKIGAGRKRQYGLCRDRSRQHRAQNHQGGQSWPPQNAPW